MFRGWLLFLILLCLYVLTWGGHLYSPDEEIMFRTVESLARHGSLAIEPMGGFATRKGLDGNEYAQYGVGQPILAVPFYWAGSVLRTVAPDQAWLDLGRRLRTDYLLFAENTPPSELAHGVATRLAASAFNLLVTALSGLILFYLLRRLCADARAAWLSALLWGAGSVVWPHGRTFFTEPLAGLCLLTALALLARYFLSGQGRWQMVFGAGLAAGYGCLVRLDSVVFLPGLALLVVWGDFPAQVLASDKAAQLNRLRQAAAHLFQWRSIGRLMLFALPVAAAGAVILGLNALHFGGLFSSAYSDQPEGIAFTTPVLAGLYGFLMSVGKGLFFFSPALVLCFCGFGLMLRRCPVFSVAILMLVLLFLLFQSSWQNWAGGWCWGPRHIIQIHALLAVPIAFWIAERWNALRRIAIIVAFVAGAAVQIYGCSQNFIQFYRIYYRDPMPPNAQPLYDLENTPELPLQYRAFFHPPQGGSPVAIPLTALPAPINDSIYIVQNSQWTRYAEMLRMLGIHDFFWLNLLKK